MKKLLLTGLAALLCILASAQAIRDIETTVHLFKNGNAVVVQKWDLTTVEGTEWYIPIDNPGKSYIHDFTVFENDEEFANDGRQWDSDRSMAAKAKRCGIIEKRGGNIELCWGLGSYGDHVYTLIYIIDNLVQDYGECDGFHWHFLNDEWSVRPKHASIKFVNQTENAEWYWNADDDCNVRYWGFGMIGESWMEDGTICFESSEPFQYKSFFSALIRFDKGLFSPTVTGYGTFEELKDEAMKGSDYDNGEETLLEKIIFWIIVGVFVLVPVLLIGLAIFLLLRRLYRRITGKRYDKKIFGTNKIEGWWRDVPLEGNPTALYSMLQTGDFLAPGKNKMFPNLVSAYFLKWIQEGLLTVERDPKKDKRVNLRFNKGTETVEFEDGMEGRIYRAALEAAGSNLLLEANEFKWWSYKHDSTVVAWPQAAIESGSARWRSQPQEELVHAVEFKNFLNDFTVMDQREAPEVKLWKQYMVLAASLGIADKVAKNFEKLFPKMMEEYARQSNMMDTATTYLILNNLNTSSTAMVSSALNRQEQRQAQARRSSGGGGHISFGGGGGGFGGGHGGGAR